MRKALKVLLWLLLLFLLYVTVILVHGSLTDYVPEAKILITADKEATQPLPEDSLSTLSFTIWNIGYCGLGAEADFFYHGNGFFVAGDNMVRPTKEYVDKYYTGVKEVIKNNPSDFFLLQEVDFNSKRSYYTNQHQGLTEMLPSYYAAKAYNYKVSRVPAPALQPWNAYGKTESGLSTLSRYQPTSTTRLQLPGEFDWPTKYFMLDRCLAISRYPLSSGKELVIINLHNSAYDKKGVIKKLQTEFLQKLLLAEYEQGNYVVAGGDWNQCPPGLSFDHFMSGKDTQGYSQINIPEDYLPEGWRFVYDPKVPTNRKNKDPYIPGETFVTLIDFFLLSPNMELLNVEGVDTKFAFSDHQPVKMEVRLVRD